MRRLLGWAVRLYPRAWRERYGEEFAALLEDSLLRWRDAWDVAKEALAMQVRRAFVQVAAGIALGALIGGLISLDHERYVVSTVIAISGPGTPPFTSTAGAVNLLVQNAFTREALGEILATSRVYEAERSRKTPDQLIHQLRDDIRVGWVPGKADEFTVAFAGASPHLAAEIDRRLVARLVEGNLRNTDVRSGGPFAVKIVGWLPLSPQHARPTRFALITEGAALGALAGAIFAWIRRRSQREPRLLA